MAGGYYISSKASDFGPQTWMADCSDKPLTFRIGSNDARFGVSEQQVKKVFKEGAEAWSSAAGRVVAVYDEEGSIPIRLIYDERQEMVDNELSFRKRIKQEEMRVEAMEAEFRRDSTRYEQRLSEYHTAVEATQNKIDALNNWVRQKNEAGGLQEQEVADFERKKSEVDQLEKELNREDRKLKSLAGQLNRKIDRLNRRVEAKNKLIDSYNKTYAGDKKITRGTFGQSDNQQSISIHQFSNINELRVVITHELGHALGLDHVKDPKSVMYHEMTSQPRAALHLTAEDIDAIQRVCGN